MYEMSGKYSEQTMKVSGILAHVVLSNDIKFFFPCLEIS